MQNNPLPQNNDASGSKSKSSDRQGKQGRGRGAARAATSIRINISIAPGLVDLIDEAAEKDFTTRSDVIRTAVLWYLRPRGGELDKDDPDAVLETLRRRKARASSHKQRQKLNQRLEEELLLTDLSEDEYV